MRARGKFGFWAAMAALVWIGAPAQAQDLGGTANIQEPAVALIMPFDSTEDRTSFQIVSRIGGVGQGAVATHWSFWAESCDHLADVFICLTPRDTVVVDPTALQGQIQSGQGNTNTGPVINLSGEKGFVTVTAFDAGGGSETCQPADPETVASTPSLVGSWVVSNTSTHATFGNNVTETRTIDTLGRTTAVNAMPAWWRAGAQETSSFCMNYGSDVERLRRRAAL